MIPVSSYSPPLPPPINLIIPEQPSRPSSALSSSTPRAMTNRFLRDGTSLNIGGQSLSSASSPIVSEYANDFGNALPFQGSDSVMFDPPRIQQYQEIPYGQVQPSHPNNHSQRSHGHSAPTPGRALALRPTQQQMQQEYHQAQQPSLHHQHQYLQQQPISFLNIHPAQPHPSSSPTTVHQIVQYQQQQQHQYQHQHQLQQEAQQAQLQAFLRQSSQQSHSLQSHPEPNQPDQKPPQMQDSGLAMSQSHQQQQIPQSPYPQQQQLQLRPQHVSSVSAPNSTPAIKFDARKPFIHGDIVMIPYGEKSWYALDDYIQRQVEESLASATAAFSAEVVTLREEITRSRTERDQMVTASNISGRQYTELHREHQKALERIRTLEKPMSDPNEVSRHNAKVVMELKAERDLQAEIIATLKKKLMISIADMDQAKKLQSEADLRARQTETELERTRAFGEAKSERIGKSIEEAMEKVESLKEAESSMKSRYDDLHKMNGALTKRIAELEVAALLTKSSVLPSPPIALSNAIADQVATSVPTAPNQSQSIKSNALIHRNDLLKNQLKIAREELKQARVDVDDARRHWKGMDQGQGGEEGQVNSTETKIRSLESTIDDLQISNGTLKLQVDTYETERQQRRVKEMHIQNAREITKLHVLHTGDYTDLRSPPPPSSPVASPDPNLDSDSAVIERDGKMEVDVMKQEISSVTCDCGRDAIIQDMTLRSEQVFIQTLKLVAGTRGAVQDKLDSSPLSERKMRLKQLETIRRYGEMVEGLVDYARERVANQVGRGIE